MSWIRSKFTTFFTLLLSETIHEGCAQHVDMSGSRESLVRLIDVSRQCELKTVELWNKESVKWISPFEIECEVSPCNFTEVKPAFQAEYKAQCHDLGGQFVEYTYKFTQQWRDMYYEMAYRVLEEPVYFEVFNAPDCIGIMCDPNHYASFLQGVRQSDERFDKDSIFIFAQDSSDFNQCLNGTSDIVMPEMISPMDIQCATFPCNAKSIASDNYDQIENACKSIDGLFVEFTFVFYKIVDGAQLPDASGMLYNYPKCISQNCSSKQYASYYQGLFPDGVYVITQDSTVDTTSSSSSFISHPIVSVLFATMIGWWIY